MKGITLRFPDDLYAQLRKQYGLAVSTGYPNSFSAWLMDHFENKEATQ